MFIDLFDLKWAFKFCGQFAIFVEKVIDRLDRKVGGDFSKGVDLHFEAL